MKTKNWSFLCLLLVAAMLLTACGGGGDTSNPAVSDGGASGVPSSDGATTTASPYLDDDTASTDATGTGSDATGTTTVPGGGGDVGPLKSTTTQGGGNTPTKTQSTGNGTTKAPTQSSGGAYNPYAGLTSEESGKTVRILIVNGPGEDDTTVGDAFKKAYGVRYRFVGVPLPMYKTKLAAMVASKDAPDLAVMTVAGTGDYPAMILNGMVQPLPSGIFDLDKDTELDRYQMEYTSWGGKMYGVQLKNSTEYQRGCIIYNKAKFIERGVKTPYEQWKNNNWTRETFAETAKKMTYTEGGTQVYGYAASDGLTAFLHAAQVDFVKKQAGDKFVSALTDPKVLSIMQWAADLREKGYWYKDPNSAKSLFSAGQAAMYGEKSWVFANLTGLADEIGKNNLEVVPVPAGKGEATVVPIDASVWCVPAGAKNPKAACYFARYWLDTNNQDLSKYYANKQLVEMHNYMSYADKKFSGCYQGVIGYDDITKASNLTYAFQLTPNDIPVFLEEQKGMVDGIINRINGMKAPAL